MKSLYSGVAGLKTHTQKMDVIGNNISNVNTTGYKTSAVTFKDVYYQTKANASSGDATSGGKNPTQIGYGSQLGTISQIMSQSGFTYSDSVYDCALQGEGFFQVMDEAGNIYYTRAGKFSVDSYGNLCDPSGNMVLGVSGDPTGVETGQSQRINLRVPAVDNNVASATKTVNGYDITISAANYGEEGNITFNVVDSDTPYATKTGDNLTIYMDLDQDFGAEALAAAASGTDQEKQEAVQAALAEFEAALNDAINRGGVGLSDDVVPLDVEFGALPPFDDVQAISAKNTLSIEYVTNTGGTDVANNMDITFTALTPGEYANKYEIDLKASDSQNFVTAKWKNNVLTLTVPASGRALKTDGSGTYYDTIQEAINDALTEAAGGQSEKLIEASVNFTRDGTAVTDEATNPFDFSRALSRNNKDVTERVGLDGGKDNFFSDIATALSTVSLTDGRVAAEQSVADLEVVQIDTDGVIYGRHAVHGLLLLGRIDIATFENPVGLEQCGTSLWRESLASGEAQVKIAGQEGAGEVIQGALEMSNVDLAQEFSDMIITQRGYQANSRIITVSDTMLEELVNLKR